MIMLKATAKDAIAIFMLGGGGVTYALYALDERESGSKK